MSSRHVYRWLYTLFLAVDANFRLTLKDKGLKDIALGPGWAYQVEETRFQNHITSILDQREVTFATPISRQNLLMSYVD